jgi:hypothetical protein
VGEVGELVDDRVGARGGDGARQRGGVEDVDERRRGTRVGDRARALGEPRRPRHLVARGEQRRHQPAADRSTAPATKTRMPGS